jgi:hypothetical protein
LIVESTGDKTVDRILKRREKLGNKDEKADVVEHGRDDETQDSEAMKNEVTEGAESGEAAEQKQNPPTE